MILLINCSKGLKLIIGNDKRILARISKPRLRRVSERLILEIKILLKSIKKDYGNLSKIIVVNGPGSFTGIRTAITAAKVLGLSLDLPVCGVSLFDLLLINYLKNNPKKNLKLFIQLNKYNFFSQKIFQSGKKSDISLVKLNKELLVRNKDFIFIFDHNILANKEAKKLFKEGKIIIINDVFNESYKDLVALSEKKYIPNPIYVKTF